MRPLIEQFEITFFQTFKLTGRILGFLMAFLLPSTITPLYGQADSFTRQIEMQTDNDALRIRTTTDRFYSFGLGFTYRTALEKERESKQTISGKLFQNEDKIVFSNQIFIKGFTPEYREIKTEDPVRPFSGISTIQSDLTVSNIRRLWKMGVHFGVRGRISGAEWIQDTYHRWISSPIFEGWKHQLPNKFLIGVHGSFFKPLTVGRRFEFISETNTSLGNYQIFLEEWIGFRFGILNKPQYSSYYNSYIGRGKKSGNEVYIVFKIFGRVTVTDATLSRENGKQEVLNPLDKRNQTAGYQAGLQTQLNRFGIKFLHTRTSTDSNLSEKHSYGTIAVSYAMR